MEEREYHNIFKAEETQWWYVGLRQLALDAIERHKGVEYESLALDAGCGTGGFSQKLNAHTPTIGLDISTLALELSRTRGLTRLVNGSVIDLPFKDKSFSLVTSLDVLYHMGVADDVDALKEFHRVMTDDGVLVANFAAYEFLRSEHDRVVHGRRRYTKRMLNEKLLAAGFEVDRITYRNTLLFPGIILIKLIKSIFGGASEDTSDLEGVSGAVSGPINSLLRLVVSMENRILRFMDLPFGSSVFCVARKKAQ